jgi:hypothetical protein
LKTVTIQIILQKSLKKKRTRSIEFKTELTLNTLTYLELNLWRKVFWDSDRGL